MPDNIVDSLRVKIEGDSRAASNTIDALVADLGKLKTALDPLKDFKMGELFPKGAASGAKKFSDAIGTIDTEKLREIGKIKLTNIQKAFSGFSNISAVLSGLKKQLTSLSGVLKRANEVEKKIAPATRKASNAINGQAKHTMSLYQSLGLANTRLGRFFKSIARIGFYRAVRFGIKLFTDGLKEGIENLYFWSQAVGTSFAPSLDRFATAALYLRNGFASMFSPLIEYAIPIIDRAIDRLVDFFNLIQEGFARLVGAPTWNKALKYPVQFAENTDGATKSAKALHNILMGFDEMNVINTPNDSGRGSGAGAKDYSSMFMLMETQADDAKNMGERLAEVFNKFFDADWEKRGRKLGDAINTVVENIQSFLTTFDEKKAARSLTDSLRGALEQVDFNQLGVTAVKIPREIISFIFEFVRTFPVAETANALSEFLNGISNEIIDWVKDFDLFEWTEIWEQKIYEFIIAINWVKVGTAIVRVVVSALYVVLEGIVNMLLQRFTFLIHVVGGLASFLKELQKVGKFSDDPVTTAVLDALIAFNEGTKSAEDSIASMLTGSKQGVLSAVDEWADEVDKTYGEEYRKEVEQTIGTWKKIEKETKKGIEGVAAVVRKELQPIRSTFNDFMDGLLQKTSDTMYQSVQIIDTSTGPMVVAIDKTGKEVVMKYDDYMKTLKENTKLTLDNITGYYSVSGEEWYTLMDANGNETIASYSEVVSVLDAKSVAQLNKMRADYAAAGVDMSNAFGTVPKSIQQWKLWDKLYTEAYNAGQGFKSGLAASMRYFSLNIPATISVTNTTSRQKVHGATFDMSLFSPYASGGYPQLGEPFFMGEGGVPEMLGKVNGRSAVVGGAEITGISDTIRAQGAREERLLETLIGVLERKDFSFTPNAAAGRAINQALRQYAGVTG